MASSVTGTAPARGVAQQPAVQTWLVVAWRRSEGSVVPQRNELTAMFVRLIDQSPAAGKGLLFTEAHLVKTPQRAIHDDSACSCCDQTSLPTAGAGEAAHEEGVQISRLVSLRWRKVHPVAAGISLGPYSGKS
jgi:hypothetical protein